MGAVSLSGQFSLLDGRASLILSEVLRAELRGRMPLAVILQEMRLTPEDRAAALQAAAMIEETGESWRLARLPRRGNAATGGNDSGVASDAVVPGSPSCSIGVDEASRLLGLGVRRTRDLARAGDLGGVKLTTGWRLDRAAVVAEAARRRAAA